VALKELLDNALDACETANVAVLSQILLKRS
jgi:DNA topoisomerase VI subunit B